MEWYKKEKVFELRAAKVTITHILEGCHRFIALSSFQLPREDEFHALWPIATHGWAFICSFAIECSAREIT